MQGQLNLEEKGDHHVEKRQRQDPCMTSPGTPRKASSHLRLRETHEAQKEPTLPTPGCQTSGLQN